VVQENKTNISYSNELFSENRAVDEIMWKNILVPDSPQIRP